MDPFIFGMMATGMAGGSLIGIHVLGNYGIKINETAVKVMLEILKTGGILYLLDYIQKIFL